MEPIETDRQYAVTPSSDNVVLIVTLGEGQLGSAAIVLNGEEIARGSEQVRADLGPASSLRNATVKVFSRINRTSASTSRFSVSYDWSGGRSPQTDVDDGDFTVSGDPAQVKATYVLA